ncbi:MAG: HlyD family efflux transporter periplasmic adaptor subunit [Gammaproteobacteria bacterium]|nr:HlyD family efflux transporter periplasmic adaptor subunit [Gammaproteobacteria bacterium]
MEEQSPDSNVVQDQRVLESEQRLWAEFADASTVEAFCQSWLAIQCRQLDGVRGGAVLAVADAGMTTYAPVAVWPDVRRDMAHLGAAAEQALTEKRGVLRAVTDESGGVVRYDIAYPVEVADQLQAVAVLEVAPQPEAQLQDMLRRLHWGIAWLIDLFRRLQGERDVELTRRITAVLDMVAAAVEARGFQGAATTFATEIAARLRCDRVAVGFIKGRHVAVRALSHSAHFKQEANLIRAIGAAMDEAIDQQAAIVYPELPEGGTSSIVRAARELCEQHNIDALACIPFNVQGGWAGAVSLERTGGEPFERADIDLAQATVALVGPILEVARRDDRPLLFKAGDSARTVLEKFVGAGHVAWKLAGIAGVALLAFLSLATGTHRVTADAATEGSVQTAVVAPFSGYIADASKRAGDVVGEGEVVAILDDRDLQLERLKWASQRDQVTRQLREAKAQREMANIRILEAQLGQTEAQLALVSEQLARTRLTAPYEGVVITGDLSQSLGAPVERGEVLFEVAPLAEYRLVLQVDDRDISRISVGQGGALTLAALPDQSFPFEVARITPVATAEEGLNYFRVEATLTAAPERLRPGMNGIAKIDIGERRLIWIWTHRMREWVKLQLWTWWP